MEQPSTPPWPLMQVRIEPTSKAGRDRLESALSKLTAANPAAWFGGDLEDDSILVSGNDELELDQLIHALTHDHDVNITVGAPQVAYRETISIRAVVDYTHKRLFGGSGQFAHIRLMVEPSDAVSQPSFTSTCENLPRAYLDGVELGVKSALPSGPLAGFPIVGVRITLLEGTYHDVDSSVRAFEIAGRAALRDAVREGGVVLIQPMMAIDIEAPAECVDAIVADLTSRRGRIIGRKSVDHHMVVRAVVPLATMFRLESAIAALSKGQATCQTSYSHYERVDWDDDLPPSASAALRA